MMRSSLAFLAIVLAAGVGCDHDLDTVEGTALGEPTSVVFSRNDSGHIMLVMSNLPDLCDTLAQADHPDADDFWVLSTWTQVGVDDPGEYAVEALAVISENEVISEFDTEAGGIKIKRIGVDEVKAKVDLTFPGNDRVKAMVVAKHCDADLFVGMY